ncbi:MAG: ParA family protein [Bacteroidia bacterium]|nr:ParA family protein [Bacteroidia bacterium]
MTRIISIINHKGGVGKTSSTIAIGASLNLHKKKVLLIDLDAQANLTQSLGFNETEKSIYGALKGQYALPTYEKKKGFDIVPSTLDLTAAEIELSSEAGREFLLKELIAPIKNNYDYILIDCPPALGLLTLNALTASTDIIIPVESQYLALQGMAKLMDIVNKVQSRLNKDLKIMGILVTKYEVRQTLDRNIVEVINNTFGDKVFKTYIRKNIAIAEAPTQGVDIFEYNDNSSGAEDYKKITKEIMKL